MVRTRLVSMRAVAGVLSIYLLALLLAGSAPSGSDAVHHGQLLHPAFPHLHIENGRVVVHVYDDQPVERPMGIAYTVGGTGAAEPLSAGGEFAPAGVLSGDVRPGEPDWRLTALEDAVLAARSDPPPLRPPSPSPAQR